MANPPDVSLTVLNSSIREPIVYVGVETELEVSLVNNSDKIILTTGASTSSLKIFMPPFFTTTELQNMNIVLNDWTFKFDTLDESLVLTYAGPSPADWNTGQKIAFKISGVKTDSQPTSNAVEIIFQKMGGNVPRQVQKPLSLIDPPQQGNASLLEVLQVSLDSQGSVYVSTETDPLQNTLFLNFKNIGATALYSGEKKWTETPQVTVMFVYGSTSGALAPDNDPDQPAIGSAWNIDGGIAIDQTDGWQIKRSSTSGDHPHPTWLLTPVGTNHEIIGTGEKANVTFSFSKIVSLTAPGHTQMIVNFSGFMKDETRRYDDAVFVVDIVKQKAPPTRGLLNFFGDAPVIAVTTPTHGSQINLRWAMFDVAAVSLICSYPGMNIVEKKYPNPLPLAYDNFTLNIPGTTQSLPIFTTLQAFDGNGGYLNSMQFTVFINALMFVDPRDGRVYPVVLVNNQLWMAENLAYNDPGESYAYNNLPGNEKIYGRLYTARAGSVTKPPTGWRIPSQKDWQGLFDTYGNASAAYKALIEGGKSGFGAKLGGYRDPSGVYRNLLGFGYYRTSNGTLYAGFSASSQSVNLVGVFDESYAISIRYVRDV